MNLRKYEIQFPKPTDFNAVFCRIVVPITVLLFSAAISGCTSVAESVKERVQRLDQEKQSARAELASKFYEINKKVYDCDQCPLSDSDKSLAIRCKLNEMAGEKGLTTKQMIQDNQRRNAPHTQTPVTSSIEDGREIHSVSPSSAQEWDEFVRQAKKRDEEAKKRARINNY